VTTTRKDSSIGRGKIKVVDGGFGVPLWDGEMQREREDEM